MQSYITLLICKTVKIMKTVHNFVIKVEIFRIQLKSHNMSVF